MKKAYLVEYSVMIRVVVDDDGVSEEKLLDLVCDAGAKQIAGFELEEVKSLLRENMVTMEEDLECPYDGEEEDNDDEEVDEAKCRSCVCPKCESDSIECVGDGGMEGDMIFNKMYCSECGAEWTAVYEFSVIV